MAAKESARSFDAGILTGAQMQITAKWIQWVIAGILLFVSLLGTHVQFMGGWDKAADVGDAAIQTFLISIVYQAVCSIAQWAFLKVKAWPWYMFFLAISVAPSILSYWEYTGDYFAARMPTVVAMILVGFACIVLDWLPERILIKRG